MLENVEILYIFAVVLAGHLVDQPFLKNIKYPKNHIMYDFAFWERLRVLLIPHLKMQFATNI